MAVQCIAVGWARRDVSPDRPVNLCGQFHTRISEHVKDRLVVTALALSSEGGRGEQAVFVSCDTSLVPLSVGERCRELIGRQLPDLDPRKVILSATHTHTAPTPLEGLYPPEGPEVMTPTEYAEFFCSRVAEAVAEAWESRQPASVAWGFGHAVVGHNRRAAFFDGHSQMYANTDDEQFSHIEGYEDHSVDLLFSWDEQDRLTGVVVNLACPSQEVEGASYVSADFWHDVCTELATRLGADVCVLPQCSPAGDQSPHLLVHKAAEQRMLELRGLEMRQELGRRIADTVEDVLPFAAKDRRRELPFRHTVQTIALHRRMVTEAEFAEAKAEHARLEQQQPADARGHSVRFVSLNRCRRVMERYEEQAHQPTIPMELHVLRLGDVAFATNRFELYLDYGIRIKAQSKAVQTFLVQLTPDGTSAGAYLGTYLATQRSEVGGSYGVGSFSSDVGPEGGQELVRQTVAAIEQLWED